MIPIMVVISGLFLSVMLTLLVFVIWNTDCGFKPGLHAAKYPFVIALIFAGLLTIHAYYAEKIIISTQEVPVQSIIHDGITHSYVEYIDHTVTKTKPVAKVIARHDFTGSINAPFVLVTQYSWDSSFVKNLPSTEFKVLPKE